MTREIRPKVEPLTDAEAKWIKRLQTLLQACPSDRIAFLTSGDRYLTVVDGDHINKFDIEVCDGEADRNGVVLTHITSKPGFIATTN